MIGRLWFGCLIGIATTVGTVLTASTSYSAKKFSILHTFVPAEGSGAIEIAVAQTSPYSPPVVYGSAFAGGISNGGTLFEAQWPNQSQWDNQSINPKIVPMFDFGQGQAYGESPDNLVYQGGWFGSTQLGGPPCAAQTFFCGGEVFRFDGGPGNMTVLHRFAGGTDGVSADALISDGGSGLYGVSAYGGGVQNAVCNLTNGIDYGGCGYVFQIAPGQPLKIIHKFAGGRQGGFPGQLVRRPDGTLVGTAEGGANDYEREIIYTLSPGGAFNIVYTYLGTSHCSLKLGPKLLADSKGDVYTTSQACPFGGNGAAILKIDTSNAVHMVRYAKNTATTSASYAIYNFDAVDVLYASEANQILYSASPRYDYVTEMFSVDTTGKKVDMAWIHNLSVSSLVPIYNPFATNGKLPPIGLYGAGQVVPSDELAVANPILFRIDLP